MKTKLLKDDIDARLDTVNEKLYQLDVNYEKINHKLTMALYIIVPMLVKLTFFPNVKLG